MRVQPRSGGSQAGKPGGSARRGPKIKKRKLSRFGVALHPYIEAKNWGHTEIADALNLGHAGRQVIGRMLRGETRTLSFTLDALLRALDVPDRDTAAIFTLASALGLRFGVVDNAPAPAPDAGDTLGVPGATPGLYALAGVTHGWGFVESPTEVERDVIKLLWMGAADYAGRRAREKYYQLLNGKRFRDDHLPPDLQKQWLLRFGAIIEQAEEMAGAWHADRVAMSFQALRRMEADIARIDDLGLTRAGFGYDQAIILARKAALLRERYVDDRPLSRFYLDMSATYYEGALSELEIAIEAATQASAFERRTLYPAQALALRFQRLHNVAVKGNERWLDLSRELAAERTLFRKAHPELHETICRYFTAMGYKRLAWALRPRPRLVDAFRVRRAEYYGEADRSIAAFLASPMREDAWNAANLRPFAAPDGQQPGMTQPSLISAEQSSLLLMISGLETSVWLRPDDVERETGRLRGDAQRLYPALLAKLDNSYAFARTLQGLEPSARD